MIVEPSALIEVARICEEMNEREYLGARRLEEIISKVNRAIKWELKDFNALPITLDAHFVRWAVSFEPPNEVFNEYFIPSVSKGSSKNPLSKRALKRKIRKEIKDILVKELVSKYEKIMKELGYRLSDLVLLGQFREVLVEKDSKGKSVFEYLVEKGAIKEISEGALDSFKEELGEKIIRKIKESVNVTVEDDSVEF